MGCACAEAAVAAGHEVTLITGPVAIEPPAGCEVVHFITVNELKQALDNRFDDCDVLIMAAAVEAKRVNTSVSNPFPANSENT